MVLASVGEAAGSGLGPEGPHPRSALEHELDRRWLHYAFRSGDGRLSLIANLSVLGSSADSHVDPQAMSILLVHDESRLGRLRSSTQRSTACRGQRSASPFPGPGCGSGPRGGTPSLDLDLVRTGRPCTSQCAPFATDQHLRWQSEPGIVARGSLTGRAGLHRDVTPHGVPRAGARPLGVAPPRRLGLRVRQRSGRTRRATPVRSGVHADPATCPGRRGDGIRHGVAAWAPAAALPASGSRRRRVRAAPTRPGRDVATPGRSPWARRPRPRSRPGSSSPPPPRPTDSSSTSRRPPLAASSTPTSWDAAGSASTRCSDPAGSAAPSQATTFDFTAPAVVEFAGGADVD